jgi:hypothetical protein
MSTRRFLPIGKQAKPFDGTVDNYKVDENISTAASIKVEIAVLFF